MARGDIEAEDLKQKDAAEQANALDVARGRRGERSENGARKGASGVSFLPRAIRAEDLVTSVLPVFATAKLAGSSLARANGTEWARISSREHIPRDRAPSSLPLFPVTGITGRPREAFAQCNAIAIAATRNDNTQCRSFGLIKSIVRQILSSSSTTPVTRLPVSLTPLPFLSRSNVYVCVA